MTLAQRMGGGWAEGPGSETVKFQVFSDDTNLDSYDGTGPVWTRSSDEVHQNWDLEKVAETSEGTPVYRIQSHEFSGKYLTTKGMGAEVRLEDSLGSGAHSQWWVVDRAQEHVPVVSYKYLDGRLRGNGRDKPVTLVQAKDTIPSEETWTVIA